MVSFSASDSELVAIVVAVVLSVGVITVFLFKRTKKAQGWRWRVLHRIRWLGLFLIGGLTRKVPWKPLFIWGPWVAFLLLIGFYSFENWRGARAWEKQERELLDRGEPVTWKEYAPEVSDERNFLLDPFVTGQIQGMPVGRRFTLPRTWRTWKGAIIWEVDVNDWAGQIFGKPYADPKLALDDLGRAAALIESELDQVIRALKERPEWPNSWFHQSEAWQMELLRAGRFLFAWRDQIRARARLRILRGDVEGAMDDLDALEHMVFFSFTGVPNLWLRSELADLTSMLLYQGNVDPDRLVGLARRYGEIDCEDWLQQQLRYERVVMALEMDKAAGHRATLRAEGWGISFLDFCPAWAPDRVQNVQGWLNGWILRGAPRGWYEGWKARASKFIDVHMTYEELAKGDHRHMGELLDAFGLPKGCVPADHLLRVRVPMREQLRIDLTRIAIHLERYFKRNGRYPTELNELVPEYLDELPRQPWADKGYRYEKARNGVPELSGGRSSDRVHWYFPPLPRAPLQLTPSVGSP